MRLKQKNEQLFLNKSYVAAWVYVSDIDRKRCGVSIPGIVCLLSLTAATILLLFVR
jgi:hypothetical protein